MFQTVNYYLYFNDKLLTLLNIVDFLLCGRVNVKHHWNSHNDHVIVFNFAAPQSLSDLGSLELDIERKLNSGEVELGHRKWRATWWTSTELLHMLVSTH